MADNVNRPRTVGMLDALWEVMAELGDQHGRNTAEEIRVACVAWARTCGVTVDDDAVFTGAPQSRRSTPRNRNRTAA
jgi:hypothetical protein